MSDNSETYKPYQTLSERSQALKRNLFIWSAGRLQGGLHVDLRHPITVSALRRWINMIAIRPRPFTMYCVKIEHAEQYFPFQYGFKEITEKLGRFSNATLGPGDLALFSQPEPDGSVRPVRLSMSLYFDEPFFDEEIKLREYLNEVGEDINDSSKYLISETFIEEVISRDRGQCTITGATRNDHTLTATWIYPPLIATQPYGSDGKGGFMAEEPTQFLNVCNGLTLLEEIADLFKKNLVGIDVDDEYRIIFFIPHDDYASFKPRTHLNISTDDPMRPSDEFLRTHFKRCLEYHLTGGDINDFHRNENYHDFLEKRGWPYVDYSDPEWQTPYGQEVRKVWTLEQEAFSSGKRFPPIDYDHLFDASEWEDASSQSTQDL